MPIQQEQRRAEAKQRRLEREAEMERQRRLAEYQAEIAARKNRSASDAATQRYIMKEDISLRSKAKRQKVQSFIASDEIKKKVKDTPPGQAVKFSDQE